MIRTILVTEVEKTDEKGLKFREKRYGRFDVVALNNAGFQVVNSTKVKYKMDDATFAKYGVALEE